MRIKDGVLISINKQKDIKNGTFIIPEDVTVIGMYAFEACIKLTNITIPNSVISIRGGIFRGCSGLTNVTIGNGVISIGQGAFSGCSSLTSIILPNGVTSIGDWAFRGCDGLTSITIPNSVTSIGYGAFQNCYGLTSIEIPNNLTSIDWYAFEDCYELNKEDPKYYYKAFHSDLTCNGFQYKENEWFKIDEEIQLCKCGFHACKNAFDLFNYYAGELNKDIVIYKVELADISTERSDDSKVVAKRIRLVEKVNSYAELLNK